MKEGAKKTNPSTENRTFEINQQIISLDDFCNLANKLIEQDLYDEAISLYQTASKLFPDSLAIKLNLGKVQELKHKNVLEKQKNIQGNLEKLREQEDLLSQHYLSLATLYYMRSQFAKALELLELSKLKNENNSKTRFLIGKIFYDQGEITRAMEEFTKAKQLDPFYEDIYKYLGNIFHEKCEYEKALEAFIEAYILSGGEDIAKSSYYQRQIRLLLNELNVEDKRGYNRFFNEKKELFVHLANSLLAEKEGAFEGVGEELDQVFLKLRDMERVHKGSLDIAGELKKLYPIQGFTDEEMFSIARITSQRSVGKNKSVFQEGDLTEGIYFIHSGSIRIVKTTPFGEQVLCNLDSGQLFGEMDFIDSLRCSADALANEDSILFSTSKIKLEELFISRKHLAVQFYWYFWRILSKRIRDTNELLKSFFAEASKSDEKSRMLEQGSGEATTVNFEKKIAILKEKGLSSKELRLLATFSNEELYKQGQDIFLEGDKGNRFYIILDGTVRISKYIPGVGEEALAFLERGDFFGEMALIDNSPRSADAKAHTDATVLPIDNKLLNEILSRDVDSTYQFLYIMCKILSRRLREINLKIYQWRMMIGSF